MVVVADIDSCVGENGHLNGHFAFVASQYQRILGRDCCVAGGRPYLKFEGFVRLPFCARRCGNRFINKLKNIANLFCLFRKARGGTVVLQSQAPVIVMLGVLLFARRERVFMIYYEGLRGTLRRMLWRMMKRKVCGVICPNKRIGETYGIEYLVVTDYIYDVRQWTIDSELECKYDFATVGILSAEKGVAESIRVIGRSGKRYLVAGRPRSESDRAWLEDAAKHYPNVELKIGYMSDDEYDSCIRQARCGLLNYSGAYSEHSSGVVFDFLFRNRPVVGRSCTTLDFIAEKGIGVVYSDLSRVNIEKTLESVTSKATKSAISDYLSWNARQADLLCHFVRGSSRTREKEVS